MNIQKVDHLQFLTKALRTATGINGDPRDAKFSYGFYKFLGFRLIILPGR